MGTDVWPYDSGRGCESIDEVIDRLEGVVADCVGTGDRIGLFAALYLQVTRRVAQTIDTGGFDDGPRMNRFDAHFGDRYLQALHGWRATGTCTGPWRAAFTFARTRGAVVQHLLLGITAHIVLDLGVAAALTAPGDSLPALRGDYLLVNEILDDVVREMQDTLNAVSPVMRHVDAVGLSVDEALMGVSIRGAREQAWNDASALAPLASDRWHDVVAGMEGRAVSLARLVTSPPLPVAVALTGIARREVMPVSAVISALAHDT